VSQEPRGRGVEDRVAALELAAEARARDLQVALDRQTALLHELDHRVKNNLQLISSLMLMQARRAEDPAVREALVGMQARLAAVGVVHRRLFQEGDIGRFDLADFVRDLTAELSGPAGRPEVVFVCDLAPTLVASAKAAPLALLINELLTNALRHAFPDRRPGKVFVRIAASGRDLRIEIADDGVGEAGGRAIDGGSEQRFGLTIVELLGRQLQAHIVREDAHPGVRVTLSLPLEGVREEP
jgi:two-component sensor histidine kinase